MSLLSKSDFKYSDSILGGLALAFVFTWILAYPEYGPFLSEVFGPKASLLGPVFILSHGLGLILLTFLPRAAATHKKTVISVGISVFLLTCIWTFIPGINTYIVAGLLGFISAYLVLAWISGFLIERDPVIAIGTAIAGANILLGLAVRIHFYSHSSLTIAAALTGLGPLMGAFYIGTKYASAELPVQEKLVLKKVGMGLTAIIIAFAAAAYFSGGLWFRAVMPVFYFRWPAIMGIDICIYTAAIIGLLFFSLKRSYIWAGPLALSLLGLSYAAAIISLEQPAVLVATAVLLNAGMAATDFFFWMVLRGLSNIMGDRRVFGIGLGLSLFFITGTGMALDAHFLPSPLSSPTAAVIGACLLFIICPLLIWFVHPLQLFEKERSVAMAAEPIAPAKADPVLPAFWNSLTNSEKKVYELIRNGHIDGEIAKKLFISRHTVKFHMRNILRKSGASNRKELLMRADK